MSTTTRSTLRLVAAVVLCAIAASCGFGAQDTPKSGLLDPQAARTELSMIRLELGGTIFGRPESFVRKADSGSSDTDDKEFWGCTGIDGDGSRYMSFFKSDEQANESDYERAVKIIQEQPGWELGSTDDLPGSDLRSSALVNERVGGITVSLTGGDDVLHLDLESHCVAGATEDG